MTEDAETKWLDKAEEALQAAMTMKSPAAKSPMLMISKGYLALAKHAREQAALHKPGSEDQEEGESA
jgi:hypothetical protein